MTDTDLIRSLYAETLAEILFDAWAGWRGIEGAVWADCEQSMREDFLDHAGSHLERFAGKGLLPVAADYRWVYEPDGTPLGYRERQLLTEWREAPAPCVGCGTTERACARWRDGSRCCLDCRHPLRPTPTTEGDQK